MNNLPLDPIREQVTIDAPIARVFQALSDPAARTKWWGAEGQFRATEMVSDLRPGGHWSMTVEAHGKLMKIDGEYIQVDPPHKLSTTWLPEWQQSPTPSRVEFDLVERDGKTEVTLTHSGFANQSDRDNYRGWKWLLNLLSQHVTA